MLDHKEERVMRTHTKNGCREKSILRTISYKLLSFQTFLMLFQSAITTLLILPALFSCIKVPTGNGSPDTLVRTMMKIAGNPVPSGQLDVFTFNSAGGGYLDSYQHHEAFYGKDLEIRSQSGAKEIFICINGQRDRYGWTGISSKSSLDDIYIDLKLERREALCSTCEGKVMAGDEATYMMELRSMASEIVLNTIRCDFRGKSYEGEMLTDVKVYLTNVNCRCRITDDGDILPLDIINTGRLDLEDISDFTEPDMIYQEMGEDIGSSGVNAGMSFICYPNACLKESPGTPFTRLVIEGSINGETFWWPVDINRQEGAEEPGIHRNMRYIFDIVITRKGASDPDTVLETDVFEADMRIKPWKEKEEQEVIF